MYKTIKYSTTVTGSIKADGTSFGPPIIEIKLKLPDVLQNGQEFQQETEQIFAAICAELEDAFQNAK